MPSLMRRLLGGVKLPRMRPFREMGSSGTAVFGGYIQTVDRSPQWVGRQRYITSSEIVANVSIVAASVHYFLNVVTRPNWSVVPADDTPKAKELAEFVESVVFDGLVSPWPRVVRRSTSYRFHGFSLQEWTAKRRDDGKIGLADIESRPQHTVEQWVVDEAGTVTGVFQRSPQTNALLGLPRNKLIYLVDDSLTDSPEGLGAFRHMAEPYNRLKQFLLLETRAFERDLRGTPIGRAPITLINEAVSSGKLTKEDAAVLIRGMEDFITAQVKMSDTGMLLDSMPYESEAQDGRKVSGLAQWDMQLLQGSANGLQELHNAIDRIQRELSRILGTESLMLGESAGSRALSQDKSRNLYLSANAVLRSMVDQYSSDIIDPLWKLNGFDEELKPWFKAEDVTPRDVQEISGTLRDMATAGAVLAPDDPVIDDIRDLLGVNRQPEREEEDLDAAARTALGIPSAEDKERAAAETEAIRSGKPTKVPKPGEEEQEEDEEEAFDKLVQGFKAFNPNQPREPKGTSTGGQFAGGSKDDPVVAQYRDHAAEIRGWRKAAMARAETTDTISERVLRRYAHDAKQLADLYEEAADEAAAGRVSGAMVSVRNAWNAYIRMAADSAKYGVIYVGERVEKYDSDQPREPAGSETGGQFAGGGSGKTGGDVKARAKSMVEEVYSKLYQNPFNERQVGFANKDQTGVVMMELVPYDDGVYVQWLNASPMKSGMGTKGMDYIKAAATKFDVPLYLTPWEHGELGKKKLTAIFKKWGFEGGKGHKGGWLWWYPEGFEKYDPNQPREPKGSPGGGRWTAGGWAGSTEQRQEGSNSNPQPEHMVEHPTGDATQLLDQNWEEATEQDILNELDPETRQRIEWVEEELANGVPTNGPVSEGGFVNPDGTWTEERQALHADILEKFFNEDDVAKARPGEGEDPMFVFLGGRPGAGKTSSLKAGVSLDRSKFMIVAADEFQEMLPGYKPHLAGLYNQEGQYIAERAERMARDAKLNVVLDATMKSTMPAAQRVTDLKSEGYKTAAYFTHTTPQTSARRSISRFTTQGRYVPIQVSLKSISNEQTFDKVRSQLDEWALFDNNGSAPRLIAKYP